MLRKQGNNGTTDGALVVLFGMILGAILLRVVQRYGEMVEQNTATYWKRLRAQMGAAEITLFDGSD